MFSRVRSLVDLRETGRSPSILCWVLPVLLLWTSSHSRAEDNTPEIENWAFGAYATLGYSNWRDKELGFRRSLVQKSSTKRADGFQADTRMGFQATRRFGPRAEAVVQAVIRDREDLTLGSAVEWAYVAYRPIPDLTVRVGRLGIDVFSLAEYRNVGYSQLTVRPNGEFYGSLPVSALNGFDATYSLNTSNSTWRFKSQVGRSSSTVVKTGFPNYTLKTKYFGDLTLSHESGPWRSKVGFAVLELSTDPPIQELRSQLGAISMLGLPAVSSEAAYLLERLSVKGTKISYAMLSAKYDNATWSAEAELSHLKSNSALLYGADSAYITIARRFGNFTPYLTTSWHEPLKDPYASEIDWAPIPGGALLQGAAIQAVNISLIHQRTTGAGIRLDFRDRAALKFQVDRTRIVKGGYGLWDHEQSQFFDDVDRNALVWSISLDIVL